MCRVKGVRHQHDVLLLLTLTVWLTSCWSGFRTAESPPSPHFPWCPLRRGVKDEAWGSLCVGESVQSLLCGRFVYSHPLVPLDQYVLTDAHVILRVRIECYIFFFCPIVSALAVGRALSGGACVLLTYPDFFSFFCISLLLDSTRCSRLLWPVPCPSPRISHFCEEPLFLLLEDGARNLGPCAGCAHCWWAAPAARPSRRTELGGVCVCVCTRAGLCTRTRL